MRVCSLGLFRRRVPALIAGLFWPGLILLLALPPSASCWAGSDQPVVSASDQDVVAFTNVDVVPMDRERILRNQTVVVIDGVISALGSTTQLPVPRGATVVDGGGAYLMPGLVDMHVHVRSEQELLSHLAHGVTTVVSLSGWPDLLRTRARLAAGEAVGPALYTSGPILDGDPPIWSSISTIVTTPAEARRAVADQAAAGYDFIKVYNNVEPDVLPAITAAAHAHGLAVFGHIPRRGGRDEALQRALNARLDVIAHGEEYFFTYFHEGVDSLLDMGRIPYRDTTRIAEAVRLTRAAGTAVIPNLSFIAMTRRQLDSLDAVLGDPEMRYLPDDVRAMWREANPTRRPQVNRFDMRERAKSPFTRSLTRALHEAGVSLFLGTDASTPGLFPGRSAHLELAELVAAGIPAYDALAMGTRDPGRFIREHVDRAPPFGVILPGYRADLVLVRGNPLEDVGNAARIEGVMAGGRWFSARELGQMRQATPE